MVQSRIIDSMPEPVLSASLPLHRLAGVGLFVALLAVFIVPFVLFEQEVLAGVRWLRGSDLGLAATGSAFVGLLVADIFAPVPASLIGVALGSTFGPAAGALLCWLGLMGGVLVGYGAGRQLGPPLVRKVIGPADQRALEGLVARHGLWALVLLRAVPVLAEASVVVAGAAGLRLAGFVAVMALSNLGIAAVYAGLGAFGMGAGSMGLALAAAIALPALAWLLARPLRRRPASAGRDAAGE